MVMRQMREASRRGGCVMVLILILLGFFILGRLF
jgi:hypothetical protein